MSVKENKALVYRYYEEIINQRQFVVADQIIGPDLKLFPNSQSPFGPESVKQFMEWMTNLFPDIRVTIEETIAERDKVAALVTLHATQTKIVDYIQGFGAIPPSGKTFEIPEFAVWKIVNGKIVERKTVIDFLPMLRQIGGIPTN
ncbi:MAG: ester cyclase [Anaerolineae bacterium]|nr:ester cyclase [Anaerolineae bacterium]